MKRIAWSGVALTVLFIVVNAANWAWLKIDNLPPRWDEATVLSLSEYSYQKISFGHLVEALQTHEISDTKPGFISFLVAVTHHVFHNSGLDSTIWWLNLLSLLGIFYAIYGLAELFEDKWVGVLACALLLSYPNIFLWTHYFNLDLPLAAAYVMSIYLGAALLQGDFRSKWRSIAFGAVLAFGICTKHLYALFMFVPCLFLLASAFEWSDRMSSLKKKHWFFMSLALGTGVGLLYHALNYKVIVEHLRRQMDSRTSAIATYVEPPKWLFLAMSKNWNLGSYGNLHLAFFVAGVLAMLIVAVKAEPKRRLTLWVAVSMAWYFFFLVFMVHAHLPYYFIPAAPLFAFVSAVGILVVARLPFISSPDWHRYRATAVVVGLAIGCFLMGANIVRSLAISSPARLVSGFGELLSDADARPLGNPFSDKMYWSGVTADGSHWFPPFPQDWHGTDTVETIERSLDGKKQANVLVFPWLHEWMSKDYFDYLFLSSSRNARFYLQPPAWQTSAGVSWSDINGYDFIILKTGRIAKVDFYDRTTYNSDLIQQAQAKAEQLSANGYAFIRELGYQLLVAYKLPDNSQETVWKRVSTSARETGADIDTRNGGGNTPLMAAAWAGDRAAVEKLLARGADVAAIRDDGQTALSYAVQQGNLEIARSLIRRGANVDGQTENGTTPLMVAAWKGDRPLVELLLAHGADASIKRKDGFDARGLAHGAKHPEIVTLLSASAHAPSKQKR